MTATITQPDSSVRTRREVPTANSPAIITCDDRRRLGSLIFDDHFAADPHAVRVLEAKLEDADYVEQDELPAEVVTMHSTVELRRAGQSKCEFVKLAYPLEAEFIPGRVSVLDPLGIALLGSSVGSIVQWRDGGRAMKCRVVGVRQAQHADWL